MILDISAEFGRKASLVLGRSTISATEIAHSLGLVDSARRGLLIQPAGHQLQTPPHKLTDRADLRHAGRASGVAFLAGRGG